MNKIKSLIFGLIIFCLLFGVVFLIISQNEIKYCGVIKYKVDATRFGKRIAYTDPIFVVQFDGFIKEIHPSWNDYLSKNPGDKVCYDLCDVEKEYLVKWGIILLIGSLISTILFLILND